MKAERFLGWFWGTAIALAISFGGAAAVVTGFSFSQVDLVQLLLVCLAASVVTAGFWSIPRAGWLLPFLALGGIGALWVYGDLEMSVQSLLYRISEVYDGGYHWGVIQWTEEIPEASIFPALAVAASVLAMAVSGTVCRRRGALFSVLSALLPLGVCVVVTDTVPEVWCLFLVALGLVLLVLTNRVRRRSLRDGNRLTALLLVPVALAAAALLWALPEQSMEAAQWEIPEELTDWLSGGTPEETQPSAISPVGAQDSSPAEVVSLASIGAKAQTHRKMMTVTTSGGGLLYLRGRAYDTYDGLRWTATDVGTGLDPGWPQDMALLWEFPQSVEIRTVYTETIAYFPMYPGISLGETGFEKGALANAAESTAFDYLWSGSLEMGDTAVSGDFSAYEALPEDTLARAEVLLAQILPEGESLTVAEKAQLIAAYVRASAPYSLAAEKMPSTETDFALWFLESGESGYCVHFATAATVLLRAAGIPARYVTGYIVQTDAEAETTVTSDDAHAWTEYLDPARGWVLLDATPGSGLADTPTEPTETTAPTETPTASPEETGAGPVQTSAPTLPEETQRETQSQTAQTVPAVPAQTGSDARDWQWLWNALGIVASAAGLCLALWGQYRLRLAWRRRRRTRGTPNRQVLEQWRQLRAQAKHLGQTPPERLEFLAEKARFSQHRMTPEEIAEFDAYRRALAQSLRAKRFPARLALKLIWAMEA